MIEKVMPKVIRNDTKIELGAINGLILRFWGVFGGADFLIFFETKNKRPEVQKDLKCWRLGKIGSSFWVGPAECAVPPGRIEGSKNWSSGI